MSVLVTGATGVVGANLVRFLARNGEEVRVLLRNNDPYNDGLKDLTIERAYGDSHDLNSLRRVLKGCKEVYHTEELNPFGYCHPRTYDQANVEGTRKLFQVALERGVRRVVYTSSAFTIGSGSLLRPASETATFNLDSLRDPYIESKRKAESLAMDFLQRGLEVVILNPGLVLGPWNLQPTIGNALLQVSNLMTKLYPGGGSLISDAEDLAKAHRMAMDKGAPGERYIIGSENTRYSSLLDLLERTLGFRPFSVTLPRTLALLLGRFSDTFAGLTGRTVPFVPSTSVIRRTYVNLFVSPEKATLRFGMSWTPVADTLSKTVGWLMQHGLV
jgi:dihydroflavonol-4-reductase